MESSCTLQERAELEEDWDHFSLLLESMLHRVPTMKVPDASWTPPPSSERHPGEAECRGGGFLPRWSMDPRTGDFGKTTSTSSRSSLQK